MKYAKINQREISSLTHSIHLESNPQKAFVNVIERRDLYQTNNKAIRLIFQRAQSRSDEI